MNNKKHEQDYIRVYTSLDKTEKSIKVQPWRSFKEETRVLGITEYDIFQVQLVKSPNNN
ncbi:hypothetical protein [Bacillus thuringiensis]|uniref:hypothetical protein n=1 Tax=Bacillus thuringiensis TaxID=1428 RepID=UPI000B13861C|nr:hypothetical protein [Bacillus thuringiensis]MEC3298312.1 hypothetical protein [Bacillus thuringiensis]MEC3401881.1 hypothetical protein [Bacillus thuringiensis]MED2262942.1 hypothetical protein [Bacillus thuringiensis]MED2909756.1 hypothetical protein [Bacillus thuringiensis]MED3114970.1 hypothetical protein [Bacillus thuringiensis]